MVRLQPDHYRILVLARPSVSRRLELVLQGVGYEVHRTPDASNLAELVARLHPALVIVSLDSPWFDEADVLRSLAAGPRPVPILLLGDERDDVGVRGAIRLPVAVDNATLVATANQLRAVNTSG
jgi:DNA-binding response OmpR family regulator